MDSWVILVTEMADNSNQLPENWKATTFGKMADFLNGYAFAPDDWKEDGLPIIRIEQLRDEQAKADYYDKPLQERFRIRNGDLIFSWSASLLTRIWDRGDAYLNQHLFKVENHSNVNRAFLKHLIDFNIDAMASETHGSTMKHITRPALLNYPVKTPVDPDEQYAIANILSTLDEAIARSESLVRKYQSIKQGLMSDLLTRGVDENGELRPSYEEVPELYSKTLLGWLPREWEIKKVDDAFNLILGKMLSKVSKKGKSPFSYLANRNVQWDKLDLSDLDWMDFSDAEREKLELLPEDLLVCEGGEVGRTAIWNNEMKECYFQKAIHRLRSKDRSVLPRFMLRYMRFAAQSGLFTNFTSQTSISHLTQEKLKTLPLIRPKMLEQERIIKIFDNQDELASQEEAALKKLLLLKQGLMQDLLSGQVRVKV